MAKTLYIQIPDSDPAGVVAACNGYLETFGLDTRVSSLGELAQLIGRLTAEGYVVALDEFQYFHRKQIAYFCSLMQAVIDDLAPATTFATTSFAHGSRPCSVRYRPWPFGPWRA